MDSALKSKTIANIFNHFQILNLICGLSWVTFSANFAENHTKLEIFLDFNNILQADLVF